MFQFPPKKILVPFDFTGTALTAWHHAERLGKRFSSSIEALYVEEPPPPADWPIHQDWKGLNAKLKIEIKTHIQATIGNPAKVHIVEGYPVATILQSARTHKPDLLVMGTHGRTGLDHILMGSVAEAVVRQSPVPVLTARSEPRPIHAVLAPINFTDYSEYGFLIAANIAAALRVRLNALHIVTDHDYHPDPKMEFATLVERLPDAVRKACKPEMESFEGQPTEGILSSSGRNSLIVLVAHRKPLLKDFVLGMTVERVLRHSMAPVLSVPSPRIPFSWDQKSPELVIHGNR